MMRAVGTPIARAEVTYSISRTERNFARTNRQGIGQLRKPITSIVFACDAGMGSSAMGASVLRKKVQQAGHREVKVTNQSIANLTDDYGMVVTHRDLTDRARLKTPSAVHISVADFMSSPRYDEIVELLGAGGAAAQPGPEPTPEPDAESGADVLRLESIVLDGAGGNRRVCLSSGD